MRLLKPSPGAVTSPFGLRPKPLAGASTNHPGVDFGWGNGWTISAAADGHVVHAGRSGGYGNLLKIRHKDGTETWYAHCSEIYVRPGQYVTGGLAVGKVGNTGISTAPHLHFEYRISGTPVDPVPYFSAPSGPAGPAGKPIQTLELNMKLRFITRDGTGVWYATNGLVKRKLAPGENQLLVDLGVAEYETGNKPKVLGDMIDLIPDLR